jgi:branched-subunit amino acid transport protein AzlD
MRTDGLQLHSMPSLSIPFRFFLSAPLFGILSALLLLGNGTAGWTTRWLPELMAATHLLTLGVMATIMLGALFQVLPVLSGQIIPGQRWLAPTVHLLLAGGALALAAAFISPDPRLQFAAIILLGGGFSLFLGALGLRLVRPDIGGGDSIFSIRLAAIALLISLSLGIIMLGAYAGIQIPHFLANNGIAHLRFALLGGVLLLIMGVSYQIIPMFHVTPDYPGWLRKTLPAVIFAALTVLTFSSIDLLSFAAAILLVLAAGTYVLFSFFLFAKRKRKITDYTIRFWQLGLGCLLLALLGYLILILGIASPSAATELQWGILMIPGFAISVMIGVLYKIAPFLSWLHLQQACVNQPMAILKLPTMHDLLPVKHSRIQFWLHGLAVALLLSAVPLPALSPLAAAVLAADFVWLEVSLLKVVQTYRLSMRAIS